MISLPELCKLCDGLRFNWDKTISNKDITSKFFEEDFNPRDYKNEEDREELLETLYCEISIIIETKLELPSQSVISENETLTTFEEIYALLDESESLLEIFKELMDDPRNEGKFSAFLEHPKLSF